MKILITNDDGIWAEGIYKLYLRLKDLGSVTVIAPDRERSSISHAITLSSPIRYRYIKAYNNFSGYAVNGTPADCIKLGVGVILRESPDVVVSGINLGQNDGCSVFYSGTVAGAREGALLGIPSIAISLATFADPDYTYAAEVGAELVRLVYEKGLPKATFLNVNVPNVNVSEIKGKKITRQCSVPIHTSFEERKDPNQKPYYWMNGRIDTTIKESSSDTAALQKNYVTITPLHCDLTDYEWMKRLDSWEI